MQNRLNINESFICKIWDGGNKYYSGLRTTDNEKVEIINYGKRNYDSGPDYREAKIRIGNKILTGDVEVHRDFRCWRKHNHPGDRSYNSVVLQVVLWDSDERTRPKLRIKRDLPTVILSKFLNQSIHNIWQVIINNPSDRFKLPCFESNAAISEEIIKNTFESLSIERLKLKILRIKERFQELHKETGRGGAYDAFIKKSACWEQVLYEFVFEALGYSKNKEPMLKLARTIDLKIIKRAINDSNDNDILIVQSVLYGGSGLLFDLRVKDDYTNKIRKIWEDKRRTAKLKQIEKSEWKFFRLRPPNFPTLRMAYGAQFVMKLIEQNLLKEIILSFQTENFHVNRCKKQIRGLLLPCADEYWSVHYDFGKSMKRNRSLIGTERINDIITNVIIPLVYYYSIIFENDILNRNVLDFYNKLKINVSNSVLRVVSAQLLKKHSLKIDTPAMEQGAVQLYNFYCMRERCSECAIGETRVKEKGYEYKIIFY